MTGVVIRWSCENTDAPGRRKPCDDGDKDWIDASTSLGMSRIAGNFQKFVERHGTFSP